MCAFVKPETRLFSVHFLKVKAVDSYLICSVTLIIYFSSKHATTNDVKTGRLLSITQSCARQSNETNSTLLLFKGRPLMKSSSDKYIFILRLMMMVLEVSTGVKGGSSPSTSNPLQPLCHQSGLVSSKCC